MFGGRVRQEAIQDAGPVEPAVTENRRETVEGLSRTPAHPMIPAVMISGMMLGTKEQTSIRTDRNRKSN